MGKMFDQALAQTTKITKTTAFGNANESMSTHNLISLFEGIKDGKEAGIPIQEILEKMGRNFPNEKAAKIIKGLHHYIINGDPLHEAMQRFPRAFPKFLCSLVAACQQSGNWTGKRVNGNLEPGILDLILNFLKRSQDAKQKLVSGMLYPAILLLLTALAISILSFMVLPTIKDMFIGLGIFNAMNPLSKGLFNFAEWVTENYHLVPLGLALIVGGTFSFWHMLGKKLWEHYQLRIKFIDKIFINFILAESFLLLAILNRAGLPMLKSLDIVGSACRNKEISKSFELVRVYIETQGDTLSTAMERAHFVFAGDPVYRVSRAEETGNIDSVLINYANQLFTKLDQQVDALIKLAEPAVIILAATVIGLIAVSFYGALSSAIAAIR